MRHSVREVVLGGGGFDLLSLFQKGAYAGFYYDFTLPTGLYQDDAGASPVTADGQSIGYITDRGPNALNVAQSTSAAKATWKTGAPSYASFDGGDKYEINRVVASGVTVCAAVRVTGGAGTPRSLLAQRANSAPLKGFTIYAADINRWQVQTGSGGVSWDSTTALGPTVVIDEDCVITVQIADGDTWIQKNLGTKGTSSASVVLTGTSPLYFGVGGAGASFYFPGYIYRGLVVERASLDAATTLAMQRAVGAGIVSF